MQPVMRLSETIKAPNLLAKKVAHPHARMTKT